MDNNSLAIWIFNCLSDGYDDEEYREETVRDLTNGLSNCDESIKLALECLCNRVEYLLY